MVLKHLHRRLAVGVLSSTLIAAPALACRNPAFAPPYAASSGVRAAPADELFFADPAPSLADALLADGVANYTPVTNGATGSLVGMWHAILRIGDASGPVYDEVFQQFHADGTEMIVSNGLPPALGNVCVGVWKRTSSGAYKLSHMTWNWSPGDGGFGVPGTFAGHFELKVNLRLNDSGNGYRGRWEAKNFDTAGNHLPALDAEGVVIAKRISVD